MEPEKANTLEQSAAAESFYAQALPRISRCMLVLSFAVSIVGWAEYGWRIGTGLRL